MSATTTTETAISTEKAEAILAHVGETESFDGGADYYLASDAEGREYIIRGGDDEPIARNLGSTSWSSPGFPASLNSDRS
jgi:hypothetical protein